MSNTGNEATDKFYSKSGLLDIESGSPNVSINRSNPRKPKIIVSAGGDGSITGLIVEGDNVEITGSGTLADPYVVNALGGDGGVQSITGDGVGGTPENPVLTFPEPSDIGAATSAQGALAETAVQPGDIPSNILTDVTAGTNIAIDRTNPTNPTINAIGDDLAEIPSFDSGKRQVLGHNQEVLEWREFDIDAALDTKVDKSAGMGLSSNDFTTAEKQKLAGVEDPKFKGQFPSLSDLEAAGNGEVGGYAYVDNGVTVDMYVWDNTNERWDIVVGEPTAETPSSIKSKYESNPDTNAFTDVLKAKLEAFTANFTSALKIAYDNAVTWISSNGASLLNHLSNKNNPHEVTASQIGLGNVDNTKDIDKPMSTATKNYIDSFMSKAWIPDYANMETINRITSSGGGSWTSDRTGFIYVLSRGYNSGIYNTSVVYINEKEVGRVWVEATSGTGTARSGSFANTYPVKTGDVIKVYGNLEVKCLFIPGIWV